MIRKAAEQKIEVREKMRGGAGSAVIRHYLSKEEFKAPVRLCAHLVLAPGAGIGPHQHEKEEEIFIITKGSGLHHDGQKETRVSVGDVTLTGNGASHAIRNDGKEDLELEAIIVCYPA